MHRHQALACTCATVRAHWYAPGTFTCMSVMKWWTGLRMCVCVLALFVCVAHVYDCVFMSCIFEWLHCKHALLYVGMFTDVCRASLRFIPTLQWLSQFTMTTDTAIITTTSPLSKVSRSLGTRLLSPRSLRIQEITFYLLDLFGHVHTYTYGNTYIACYSETYNSITHT